ncbi:MAG: uroporphyrinogen-III C-methyltransferase [Candidatus Omnitrophota bacterium]|nr:uroporphyrinogen-III C-methyltransferase [Candidatus Omnitrophota bacterium]
MLRSTVFLVGAGPGDEKLITVRGRELVGRADCIIYDNLVNAQILKNAKFGCKIIYVGKKASAHTLSQDNINKLLVKEARRYCNVVRLKGGDPFIFGRGAEEAVYLRKKGIDFQIVPGVTSAIAVPAYAGIPLTERSMTSTVGFITGHEDPTKPDSGVDWNALTKALGTMVFLMGAGNLGLIVKRLIASGKPVDTPVAVIRWGTTAKQKTVAGVLSNIVSLSRKNKISPPAIIVVGKTVELRKELNWFEKRPLFAKRVIVTRTREQVSELSCKLRDLGAEVIEIPTIKTVSLKSDTLLRKAFSSGKYDWVFFTSQNGVYEFDGFLNRSGKDCRMLCEAKICAIGSQTAKALRGIGIRPDYTPPEFTAESIVEHFKKMRCPGRALILHAKKAREVLPEGLKRSGFKVMAIDLYDTVVAKESSIALNQALAEYVDIITFTSSSTVENFIKLAGKDYKRKLSGVKLVSIGPVTSDTLKKFGLKPGAQAKVHTIDGLVKVLVE